MAAATPTSSDQHAPSSRSGRSALKIVVQILGFVLGIGLMVWVVLAALSPENQEQLANLRQASAEQVAGLLGLSVLVVMISGGVFRQALVPVRRLSIVGVQATNVIACLLALLPFKLSVIFRVVVHNRRDGVPLLTIGAWFAAVASVMLLTLGPVLGASVWRKQADGVWLSASLLGITLTIGTTILFARWLATERGWSVFQRLWSSLPLPRQLKSGPLIERAHEGVRMLASPEAVLSCVALRCADIGVQAARFMIAATMLGQPLDWGQAILAGGAFFLIGAAAPTGQFGAREGGTAGILSMIVPGLEWKTFAPVVLTVSAAETIVLLVGSMIGLAYLRPDRLLRLGHKPRV